MRKEKYFGNTEGTAPLPHLGWGNSFTLFNVKLEDAPKGGEKTETADRPFEL